MSFAGLSLLYGKNGAAAAPPFSPSDLSNLYFWLDASDVDTITKDGSNKVSQWDDKSANAYHFSQSTATWQPEWVDAQLNGRAVVRFDGVNDIISRGTQQMLRSDTGFTMILVLKATKKTSDRGLMSLYTNVGTGWRMPCTTDATWGDIGFGEWSIWAYRKSGAATWTDNTYGTILLDYTGTGANTAANFNLYLNETLATTTDIGPNGGSWAYSSDIGGERQNAGAVYASMNGDIAEMIIYHQKLSVDDRATVYAYIAEKWGL